MQIRTITRMFAVVVLTIGSGSVQAATCQETVARSGTLLTGRQFATQLSLPGFTIDQVFRQIREALIRNGLRITSEDRATGTIAAAVGPTLLEPSRSVKAVVFKQGNDGRISMTERYPPGVMIGGSQARKNICATLDQVVINSGSSRQPRAITVEPGTPRGGDTIAPIEAITLAREVQLAKDNPARLQTRFVDRLYRMSGRVLRIVETNTGFAVSFETDSPPEDDIYRSWSRMAITCTVTKAQTATVAAIDVGTRATLIGRFARIDNYRATPTIYLEECRAP
jgi:hypothetical protein